MANKTSEINNQDPVGRYGPFGGQYVPETLMQALDELSQEYESAKSDDAFKAEIDSLAKNYVGRPTPMYFAKNFF